MDINTELEKRIKAAAQAYYTDGSSELTDAKWDSLVEQLKSENPDSEILKQIGYGYSVDADTTYGKKIKHTYGLIGSLEKCRTWDEIKSQFKNNEVDISLKLDGISVVLYYSQGKLYQALTRGDGKTGIDITDKIQIILGRNHCIDSSFTGAVRGEIVMSFTNFNKFKELYPEAKNPRNSVAGLINSKELADELKYIDVVVYSIVGHEPNDLEQISKFNNIDTMRLWLYQQFIHSVQHIETLLTKSTITDDVFNIRDMWSDVWPSDGLVITSNQLQRIGNEVIQDSQSFKFKAETVQTEVLEVEWNMSKTRYAIPRIKIKPVQLSGTTVQYCTGYNAKYIADNHLGIGSIVEIEKRGEIIPNINEVIAVKGNWEILNFVRINGKG